MSRLPQEFKVHIPPLRTAQYPAVQRDRSKLLVYDRKGEKVVHIGMFRDVVDFIAGDAVVLNDTKVLPARVEGRRSGGGRVELLFLVARRAMAAEYPSADDAPVAALIKPSRGLRCGTLINLPEGVRYELIGRNRDGHWEGELEGLSEVLLSYLERVGQSPLPPYIRRPPESEDRQRYQTVYAQTLGSLAAPTAGLHFTAELLTELERRGCNVVRLSLDVGWGTFQPIRVDDLSRHRMHIERYAIAAEAADAVNHAKTSGRPVTAVGTTTVRALEAAAAINHASLSAVPVPLPRKLLTHEEGFADLFIYPPYEFKVVDRLVTNFHRADSTLLQLLAAFIGWDGVNLSYQTALDTGFQFYSYGDAMAVV